MSDPRLNLPRHTLVRYRGRLARTLGRELRPTGRPGLNRVSYLIEYAAGPREDGSPIWGFYSARTVPARNLEIVQ